MKKLHPGTNGGYKTTDIVDGSDIDRRGDLYVDEKGLVRYLSHEEAEREKRLARGFRSEP